MLIHPKLFFKFLVLCVAPLFLLGAFNHWNGVRAARWTLRRDLEAGLASFNWNVNEALREHEEELVALARSQEIRMYVRAVGDHADSPLTGADSPAGGPDEVAPVLRRRSHFASVYLFKQNGRPVIVAEFRPGQQAKEGLILTKDFLSSQVQPDERIWTSPATTVLRSPISITPLGTSMRITTAVSAADAGVQPFPGALVAELKLDPVFSDAVKSLDLSTRNDLSGTRPWPRAFVVLESSGRILYHPNRALLHQSVNDSMPYFRAVAQQMLSGRSGSQSFTSVTGDESEAAYTSFPALNISVATTQSAQPALAAARRAGWMGLIASILLGCLAALMLTRYWQRKARGIERLTEGVAEIAKGQLDHRIEVQSSVDMRPLADDVNLLTARLREQVAREAEAQQFQSFVRLSAMLTHDLKNAIEALSLIVANMDRHFDNENFRADAMKSLNIATQNLRALVTRLSNPVTTLSGEYKRPQPLDLVPVLERAIAITAEPVRATHQIESRLPPSLFALVDAERIGKVIENLILNALEAMSNKRGTLTVEAGKADEGKVFFSVTDTGTGMTPDFIEKRLYHPFATTKKRGVGLGLYTCREVVRAHGGSIEVSSTEGAGTTFRVVLPSAQSGGQTKQTEGLNW